jgi:hypothetical protein
MGDKNPTWSQPQDTKPSYQKVVVDSGVLAQLEPEVGPHGGLSGNSAQPLNAELPEFLRGGQLTNVGSPKKGDL